MRKIFVLTGKRGGYGAMKPMLRALRDDEAFELQLVVTDQHVSKQFGETISEIRQEFDIAGAVDMEQSDDSALGRARAVGNCAMKMAEKIAYLEPDICVLYGDRGEVLATATAATLLGLPIAHLQGGDVSGSLDEQMRHAVTKLAHLHFPSSEESAQRIRKMGEESWRIQVVGDNHIDTIVAGEFEKPEMVGKKLGLDLRQPIVVVLQHSETTAPREAYDQMAETMLAVRDAGHQTVVIYPCSDQGYEGVIRAIAEFATAPQFKVHINLDAPVFWGLLSAADVFVGNSSAGLIESPYFPIPAINIGRRQENRLHAENVMHVGHDRKAILSAVQTALEDEAFKLKVANCRRPFGDGKAGLKIVETLRTVPLGTQLLVKKFVD